MFYELGISVAVNQDILPLCLENYEKIRSDQLEKIGIYKTMIYPKCNSNDKISDYLLDVKKYQNIVSEGNSILILSHNNASGNVSDFRVDRFDYSYGTLFKNAVEYAISTVFSPENKSVNNHLKLYSEDDIAKMKIIKELNLRTANFETVISALKKTACILIDISENININYFWLGYLHGVGANVIPINRIKIDDKGKIQGSVPFDIRALWHIVFNENDPIELRKSLTDILYSIYIEKAKNLNRKKFWQHILESTEVSIFLGSLYNDNIGRNNIADWDYLTASEIIKYLSILKETIQVTLERPLPKRNDNTGRYIEWLQKKLEDKNCIIIGSADVNDLTEIALCKLFDLKEFNKIPDQNIEFKGYITYKEYKKQESLLETAFYKEGTGDNNERGFIIKDGGGAGIHVTEPYLYPKDSTEPTVKKLLGQIIVVENPFGKNGKWLMIISGTSGPATLGIAQMLTGVVHQEFTVNKIKEGCTETYLKINKDFINKYLKDNKIDEFKDDYIQYDALSEEMIKTILLKTSVKGETNTLGVKQN